MAEISFIIFTFLFLPMRFHSRVKPIQASVYIVLLQMLQYLIVLDFNYNVYIIEIPGKS